MINKNTEATEQTKCNQNKNNKHGEKLHQKTVKGLKKFLIKSMTWSLRIFINPYTWRFLMVFLPEKISTLVNYTKNFISWLSDIFF
jgi:uncharacterized protein involved in cysteine biosynthesis